MTQCRRLILGLVLLALVGSVSPRTWAVPVKSGTGDKKGPVRVLLFASGPGREYQFLKSLFEREARAKRMELGIFLQSSKVEEIVLDKDWPLIWTLGRFPDLRAFAKAADKPYFLADYDVVIACDPDWKALSKSTGKRLREWVRDRGGRLVLIAGPVHTPALVREDRRDDLGSVRDLYPVILANYRHKKKAAKYRKPTSLGFSDAADKMSFLKLQEQGKSIKPGWEEFFCGKPEGEIDRKNPVRGFYTTYPVKAVKVQATVLATLGEGQQKQPYLVTMPAGVGKVVYLGSGEIWRLRTYQTQYYDRFWLQMIQYLVPERK